MTPKATRLDLLSEMLAKSGITILNGSVCEIGFDLERRRPSACNLTTAGRI